MKKSLLLFCVVGIAALAVILSAYFQQKNEYTEMKLSSMQVADEREYVTISIADGTLTNTSMSILIENKSEKYILVYGEFYTLHQMIDGLWYIQPPMIEGGMDVIAMAYTVSPMESKEWSADWIKYYGELAAGQYRIIKEITIYDYASFNDDNVGYKDREGEYCLAVEFTIDK